MITIVFQWLNCRCRPLFILPFFIWAHQSILFPTHPWTNSIWLSPKALRLHPIGHKSPYGIATDRYQLGFNSLLLLLVFNIIEDWNFHYDQLVSPLPKPTFVLQLLPAIPCKLLTDSARLQGKKSWTIDEIIVKSNRRSDSIAELFRTDWLLAGWVATMAKFRYFRSTAYINSISLPQTSRNSGRTSRLKTCQINWSNQLFARRSSASCQ